jgi:hypothetical protein
MGYKEEGKQRKKRRKEKRKISKKHLCPERNSNPRLSARGRL